MKIKLPLNINHKEEHVDTQCLVVIGTNGIGKSSFGKMIASQYPDKSTIISGLHALFISTQPGDKKMMKVGCNCKLLSKRDCCCRVLRIMRS